MSDIDDSVYASSPFQFLIEGKTFHIHAGLVSRHSKPLDRMMTIDMSEARRGHAVLEEVDEGTFARFAEWAYQGFYTPGKHFGAEKDVLSSKDPAVEGQEPAPVDEPGSAPSDEPGPVMEDTPFGEASYEWGGTSFTKKSRIKKKIGNSSWQSYEQASRPESPEKTPRTKLKEDFIKCQPTIRKESIHIPLPRPNQAPKENYTEVFLSHARVYVFAEMYDIQPLRKLALENLQSVLAIFTLYPERTGDIIATLRYVYDKTSEVVSGLGDDLRLLLTHYVGYQMDTLLQDDGLRTLMIEDGGAFLGDFLKMVAKRIE